jgi:uncharacterized phage protein (TIGR01671 family)
MTQRPIKFRAWRPETKEMDYDFGKRCDLQNALDKKGVYSSWVIMQYTGLTDKNGKEIYEGDILKVKEDGLWGGEYNIAVEWVNYDTDNDKWAFWGCVAMKAKEISHPDDVTTLMTRGFLTRRFGSCIQLCEMTRKGFEIKVIGNIYENPELLKGGTK